MNSIGKNGNEISKQAPVPLYYQLKEILKRAIERQEWRPGDLIPSERELMERYDISRPTVRQAVAELVNEGLLRKEHGRGTFVASPKITGRFLETLGSFQHEMELQGLPFATVVVQQKIVPADQAPQEIFANRYESYLLLERLRVVKNEPYVVATTYVPLALAPGIEGEDFEQVSLYRLMEDRYHYRIGYARRTIESEHATPELAAMLRIKHRDAIQKISTVGYLDSDMPFEYTIGRYRGDVSNFTVTVPYRRP
ncbi:MULTISPECIES: GntR family transcriptional regulator [unclassified Paenibacillus]|uniref:GntR family transcriptional regulator n=1 Tax=unclassified Paenibacillus TaxID=185978 RepID=UPI001C10D20A|nr:MULTISPECIES: GntR family transcriptional regulator [unclassified Paenibacillus]MBU5441491.1 GntR family transcriptional regulator [Paenibacillus sp. MSJ-34]